MIDEPYPERVREVIDDLVREWFEWRELLTEERNNECLRAEDQ